MKSFISALVALAGLSAQASTFLYTGTTVCTGLVSTNASASAPIKILVEWGQTIPEPGNLPPYWIHQQQEAVVTIEVDGLSGSNSRVFSQTGGTTRCEWWNKSTAFIFLNGGEYAYTLEFDNIWNHSGCGFSPTGVFLSDTIIDGPNQRVELTCH